MESAERIADRPTPWRALGILTAFWIGVGLFGGTAEYLATRSNPEALTWPQAAAHFLLVSVLWIPITLAILRASRGKPPFSLLPRFRLHLPAIALHGIGSLAVGFVLNGVFFAVFLALGFIPAADYPRMVTQTAVRLMHINAGVYWVIAVAAQLPWFFGNGAEALRRTGDPEDFEETLKVRSGTQSILVRVSDIRWIEGAGDYVRLHLGIANHLHSERLKRLEARLDPHRFVRVHRSAIVNVSSVRKLRHLGHGDYEAILEGGAAVRVSRTRRSQLTQVLERREVGETEEG